MFKALLFATLVALGTAKDSYVVLSPTSFRAGVPLNISVNILKDAGDVTVQAALVNKATSQNVAASQGVFSHGHPGSLTIQVPDNLHGGSYKLHVQGTGTGMTFSNDTDLKFESKSISIFVQTDKAMYKPGQTVRYRTFAAFPNLTVYTGSYDIDIYDPNTNKIKQLRGLKDGSGVITNFMIMDSQPVLGDWKIKVSAHGRSMEKIFTVAHYVLPKFEVTVELPPFALESDTSISGTVKATYTYGKPVQGSMKLRATIQNWYRPYNYKGAEPMVEQSLTLNGNGTFTLPLDHIRTMNHNRLQGHTILVQANVTESLNKITLSGNSTVHFYSQPIKMEFLKSNPNTFKPGLPYTAYLKVVQQDDTPLAGLRKAVHVTTTSTYETVSPATTPYPWYSPPTRSYSMPEQQFTLPDSGIVAVQVDIPANSTSISLRATYGSKGSITAYSSLSKSYSPSNNYIQLLLMSNNLRAGGIASFDIKSTETVSNGVYQVLSRGSVVATGTFSGTSFSVGITDKMAPNARIVVYYVRTDGEIVTDSISFDVDGAFLNQVSIDFDKSKATPGTDVNVVVTADAKSVVNLLAVDQSVLLLKSGNDITASQVVEELKSYDTIVQHASPFCCDFGGPMMVGRKKRMIWWPYPTYYGGSDAQQIFQNAGVKVMTDALVYHHREQPIYPILPELAHGMMPNAGGMLPSFGMATGAGAGTGTATGGSAPLQEVTRVRSVFPETWLWSNTTIGYIERSSGCCIITVQLITYIEVYFTVLRRAISKRTHVLEAELG